MNKKEWFYPSSDNKTMIHAMEYMPPEGAAIKGVVQIAHGCSENACIYEELAAALAEHGFVVRANDHIGHGLSVSDGQKRNYLGGRGSWSYALTDMHALRCTPVPMLSSETVRKIPYVMIGHSMGAFLLREYLIRYDDVDAAVISGSGTQPALGLKFVQKILEGEIRKNGYDSDSAFVQELMMGSNNKKIKGTEGLYDWLVKDPDAKQVFIDGENIGGNITAGIFVELTNSMLFSMNKKNLAKMNKSVPLLFVAGKEDASVAFGKAVKAAVRLYRGCGVQDVSYRLYDNCRHCIFQDYEKKLVIGDVSEWIEGFADRRGKV